MSAGVVLLILSTIFTIINIILTVWTYYFSKSEIDSPDTTLPITTNSSTTNNTTNITTSRTTTTSTTVPQTSRQSTTLQLSPAVASPISPVTETVINQVNGGRSSVRSSYNYQINDTIHYSIDLEFVANEILNNEPQRFSIKFTPNELDGNNVLNCIGYGYYDNEDSEGNKILEPFQVIGQIVGNQVVIYFETSSPFTNNIHIDIITTSTNI